MNENDPTTPVPGTDPAGAATEPSRSAVFSAIRSIFGRNPDEQPGQQPAATDEPPPAPAEPPARIVIRNCSTRRVLSMLLQQFGGDRSVSGRYFAPDVADVAKIHAWASANGFFVKESRIGDVLVLDLMMDRTKLERPARPYSRPRFGGGGFRGRDEDDAPDEF